ncbi:glycosyltransferase [Marinobacter sp. X15-166B]|uniref:glycosyltransferase n=1 Tax=Marinobacter sp. X15-166B TaxID=1897620 RepID=UPI002AE0927A|nr:glycosyltransferase [Marinobacter sp. X15-166B]
MHPSARFILVGDGPLKHPLSTSHPDYVFCGVKQGHDLARHYASGDVFLFPSQTDTFGNVVTEAMASGLAVTAFKSAAAREHINHERNGLVCEPGNDSAFIDAAMKLAGIPALRQRVRTQARLDALELNWHTQIARFEELIFNLPKKAKHHVIKQSRALL